MEDMKINKSLSRRELSTEWILALSDIPSQDPLALLHFSRERNKTKAQRAWSENLQRKTTVAFYCDLVSFSQQLCVCPEKHIGSRNQA